MLELPLSFHSATHSGRLLKVMLDGASGMFGIWLSFFRENCASHRRAVRAAAGRRCSSTGGSASMLVVLVTLFGVLTTFVLRRTDGPAGPCRSL